MQDSADVLKAFTDAATASLAKAFDRIKAGADQAERVRDAEHRAFMAETRETMADMLRRLDERLAAVRDGVDGQNGSDGANGLDGKDGSDGRDGKDGADGVDGRDGVDGVNGVDVDMDAVRSMIADAVAAIPAPKDGASVTLDDVAPLIERAVQDAVAALPAPSDGQDGIGLADALIDLEGQLVVTMTNGNAKALGVVQGRDGAPGGPGERGDRGEPGQDGRDGTDGEPGNDGKDAYPGEAKGLFDPEAEYRAMDVVSFNGSEWRAKVDNPGELPGDGWMLSASRGKRGDRGEPGPDGKPGADGKDGATIIAAYADSKDMKLVLTRDDGVEVEADLYDLATRIKNA